MQSEMTLRRAMDGSTRTFAVAHDVAGLRTQIVNLYFVGDPGVEDAPWVLVDAGMPMSASRIRQAADERFGPRSRPRAIVMTHGHFDHTGALKELADRWQVPIYAHELELPYLDGRSKYPPPDPTVGGGMMARLAGVYPRGPIDVSEYLVALPASGKIPDMPGWQWIHTPGHTPGHVSLFREADRVLIAGDAFVTTKQESLLSVLTQHKAVHGPPAYFTQDWPAAQASVRKLAALQPHTAATGHGVPMANPRLAYELDALARNFGARAVPSHGRYVKAAALADKRGTIWIPKPVSDPLPKVLAGVAIAGAAALLVHAMSRKPDRA